VNGREKQREIERDVKWLALRSFTNEVTCYKPAKNKELIKDEQSSKGLLLVLLKCRYEISESLTIKKQKTREQIRVRVRERESKHKDDEKEEEEKEKNLAFIMHPRRRALTYRGQCDKSIINRDQIVPSLKVREDHGRRKYEHNDAGYEVQGDAPN
jgi:hypothetical protein